MDTISLLAQIEQLKEENEKLMADAERYRWLRDKSENAYVGIYKDSLRCKEWVSGETADNLVDFGMLNTEITNI
jgi:hypothetical protein